MKSPNGVGAAVLFLISDGADDAPEAPGVGGYVGSIVCPLDGSLDGDSLIDGGYVAVCAADG